MIPSYLLPLHVLISIQGLELWLEYNHFFSFYFDIFNNHLTLCYLFQDVGGNQENLKKNLGIPEWKSHVDVLQVSK